jgi:3-oxoacyl-[acyl-carrier-protein] synthase-3
METTAAPVFLGDLSLALGGEASSVEESAADGLLLSDAAALREAGFERHHRALPGTSGLDLARCAVSRLGEAAASIDALVYVTCLPQSGNVAPPGLYAGSRDVKHLMDFPASRLQAERGWDDALVVGLNQQACAGLLGSLRVAASLLRSEPDLERALCVTADRFPEGALYEQAYNVMSDGATACIVSRRPAGFRLIASWGLTNGALACVSDEEAAGTFFGYACQVVEGTLARAGLRPCELDWLVPQNMNRRALEVLARLLQLEPERVLVPSLGDVGHLVCGDNLENLSRSVDTGRIQPGETVLLLMVGYGLNWQALLLERI